ncbi:hypothetical protein IAU60_000327 [Kwoniella sp. DSM 27419]
MPSIPDLIQRSIVLTSVGLTIYGGVLITHGIGYRALRTRGYFGGLTEEERKQPLLIAEPAQPPSQPS